MENNEEVKAEVTTLDERVANLEESISKLELKDKYLELQREWDSSLVRIIYASISTYLFVAVFMYMLNVRNFAINALIPAIAYIISTQTIPFIKKYWVRYYLSKESEKEHKLEEAKGEDTGNVFK